MKLPFFLLPVRFGIPIFALTCSLSCVSQSGVVAQTPATGLRFDFGTETKQTNTLLVDEKTTFSEARGYGWLDTGDLGVRDRVKADDLQRDFVMGRTARTFRISGLKAGLYKLTILTGDLDYGDHVLQLGVAGTETLPVLAPRVAEFITLSTTAKVDSNLDIKFDSPQNNWVVNALSLEPINTPTKTLVARETVRPTVVSTWKKEVFDTDPTKPFWDGFKKNAQTAPADFKATGLSRADYLRLISSEVDFWKTHQNADGAIIDPYLKSEFQYSTPAFAHAAALLVARGKRDDLIEPATKALDWASLRLSKRQAASGHEDFYPTMIAHAIVLLKPHVKSERAAQWEKNIRSFDPYITYRMEMGSMNWNIVSSSGEALFQKMGIRPKEERYVADSLAAQGHHFGSPFGLYLEGPMAYDHFPRIFLADILAQGYDGPYSKELEVALQRAAITSLFMQSPWGELPAGGRSAHHQWNEAEQCMTYEIYAAKAQRGGDVFAAGVYKRAAHLALSSMQRWVRPSGEMQIVKNWVDPAKRHSYEGYSGHSQYNLLPMSMLASAYEYADTTEAVAEKPAPADVGGFVLEIPELHKVFANAGGSYVELDTKADAHYDATGLIRVHHPKVSPQLGPSDSLLAHGSYNSPNPSPFTTGVGVAWKEAGGAWRTIGEMDDQALDNAKVVVIAQTAKRVAFDVTYTLKAANSPRIVEHYVVTPSGVELTTELTNYQGPLRYVWPVLADDGKTPTTISTEGNQVSVSQDGGKTSQSFTALGAQSVRVEAARYSNHNGWARLAYAEYPNGGRVTLRIAP